MEVGLLPNLLQILQKRAQVDRSAHRRNLVHLPKV
jgi:hypothetical protein